MQTCTHCRKQLQQSYCHPSPTHGKHFRRLVILSRNLDQHCLKKTMNTEVKMCGLQRMQLYSHLRIFMDQRSSARVQKSDTVHLSVVMRLWVKVQLSVIQLSLKMSYFSTKFRYRIIIMWEIPFLDLRHIWEPVLLLPMLSQIRSWWLFIPVKAILRLVSRNSVQCWETV